MRLMGLLAACLAFALLLSGCGQETKKETPAGEKEKSPPAKPREGS